MHVFLGAQVLWAGDGPEWGTQNTNKNAVSKKTVKILSLDSTRVRAGD